MLYDRDPNSQAADAGSEDKSEEEFDALMTTEPVKEKKVKKITKTESRKREANDSDSSASGPSSTSPSKRAKTATKAQLKERQKEEPSSSLTNDRDNSPVPSYSSVKKSSAAVSGLLDRPTLARPASPSIGIDLVTSSQTLREKDIQPSKLNFGFLGLGIMGSGMVKNLLNSVLTVTVWNRTTEKVRDFLEAD